MARVRHTNPITKKRSKHIDICYCYICEVVEKKIVDLFFIDSANNPADLLTKNLGAIKFNQFRTQFGLQFLSPN